MKSLTPVTYKASDVLTLCADSIRDENIKAYLGALAKTVADAETAYLAAGQAGTLYLVPTSDVIGDMSNAAMKKVYKETFVKSVKTRPIYNEIMSLPEHGICPACGQNSVKQLDHYLAEAHHSALVITPINLVPMCGDCNKAKLHAQPAAPDQQTLHPYFDNVEDGVWLTAKVIEGETPALRFFPNPPQQWTDLKRQRILFHFAKFQLGALYGTQSGAELTSIGYSLRRIRDAVGPSGVRDDLSDRALSAGHANSNSWRTAMFTALAASDWFVDQGVLLVK